MANMQYPFDFNKLAGLNQQVLKPQAQIQANPLNPLKPGMGQIGGYAQPQAQPSPKPTQQVTPQQTQYTPQGVQSTQMTRYTPQATRTTQNTPQGTPQSRGMTSAGYFEKHDLPQMPNNSSSSYTAMKPYDTTAQTQQLMPQAEQMIQSLFGNTQAPPGGYGDSTTAVRLAQNRANQVLAMFNNLLQGSQWSYAQQQQAQQAAAQQQAQEEYHQALLDWQREQWLKEEEWKRKEWEKQNYKPDNVSYLPDLIGGGLGNHGSGGGGGGSNSSSGGSGGGGSNTYTPGAYNDLNNYGNGTYGQFDYAPFNIDTSGDLSII
ncbi:MAG: hypothetical protein PHE15_01660 [Dehalococcoidales bacterium]|nr:hypothetical protein [Dehalococcoidales bacterium]